MTDTNIKGLPEGRTYFTEIGYSQTYPWVEVKRTARTVTLARVVVVKDPDFVPEFHAGGFCAHCSNQQDQTWLFHRIEDSRVVTVRKTKNGWSWRGIRFIEGQAREFFDFNF